MSLFKRKREKKIPFYWMRVEDKPSKIWIKYTDRGIETVCKKTYTHKKKVTGLWKQDK